MGLISLRQLLDHAAENGYALPAFNVNNLEYVQAVMRAANDTDSPVILQASRGARDYAGDAFLRHLILGAAEEYPHTPICLHLDHGDRLATCITAITNGFTSVMMDGYLKPAVALMTEVCKERFVAFGATGQASKIRIKRLSEMSKFYC